MSAPVSIDEIEEFELVRRLPKQCINETIVAGIAKLNEKEELEPFIRDIIADRNDTPHGPKEIADILTTNITMRGKPVLAALVNKGRATKVVTEKIIAHQIVRLRDVPGVQLLVLVAVGNIQDDAVKILTRTAHDENADYMIVGPVDIARLFIAYGKVCPKDASPFQNGKCPQCLTAASEPIELAMKVQEELRFDVLEPADISTGGKKRYRAQIITNLHYSKAALREVIKKAVWELRHSNFYRSTQRRALFGEREADFVFLNVYFDLRDRQQGNHACLASWGGPAMDKNASPMITNPDETIGDIAVQWNKSYAANREFWRTKYGKKEDWVPKIEPLVPKMDEMIKIACGLLADFKSGNLQQPDFEDMMEGLESKAMELWQGSGSQEVPPLDCEDCDTAFATMATVFHNAFLPFGSLSRSRETWKFETKIWLMVDAIKRYDEDRERFSFEWKKVMR